MWAIQQLNNNTQPRREISFTDGNPIQAVRGPAGHSYRLDVDGLGFVDFTDVGHQPDGPHYWKLVVGDRDYWYDGQGAITLTVRSDGSYTLVGDGNKFSGMLTPFSTPSSSSLERFQWMIDNKYVPYQKIPDEPGRSTEELRRLGRQFFPFSPNSFELAMAVYDWTTADFTRIDLMRLFTYTGVENQPLDLDSIADGIWTSNWNTYNPRNKYYMNSFMMQPADSLDDVRSQLEEKKETLYTCNLGEIDVLLSALRSLPRTTCLSKPALYSGQVAIFNLGTHHFATYFEEMPANHDASLPSLDMPLTQALDSFIEPGKTVTLKTFMAFTDTYEDARHYSNGIILIVHPPAGAVTWEHTAYVTPLSDGPDKTEYLFEVGTRFDVIDVQRNGDDGNVVITLNVQP